MEFGVLGPLDVLAGHHVVELGGARHQKVLAALLVSENKTVPLPHLVDVVWDGAPPSTSRNQIHKCVADLRAAFEANAASTVILTADTGYQIILGDDQLDLQLFEERLRSADLAAANGRADQAAEELREALALWRGQALDQLGSRVLRADAERLNERRITVAERCFSLELELGGHRELVPELTAWRSAHPLRERLAGLLMLALARSGSRDEAVEVYEQVRGRLADDRGTEPGAWLRETYASIVDEPRSAPRRQLVLTQLPHDLTRFVGREAHVDELDRVIAAGGTTVAISGIGGVGKTALAVHWAWRVRDWFPDGQLYFNLRGHDDLPATAPSDALTQMLRNLGVDPQEIPHDLDEQSAKYRSLLADRRMLVVLDNAATEEQVRPLLPGAPGCAVVITSRSDLHGLTAMNDAHRIMLDVLPPEEAHSLAAHIIGLDRAAAEPSAIAELAELCGHLPLALRIAAANISHQPRARIAETVAELARGDRLAKLAIVGDRKAAVSAAFDLSYHALPDDARRLFQRLGVLPRGEFTVHIAAALVDDSLDRAAHLVTVLGKASLVEPRVRGWFRVHDLVRLYARDRCRADDGREAAYRRVLTFYLRTIDAALDLLTPGMIRHQRTFLEPDVVPLTFATKDEAISWLDDAKEGLVRTVVLCAENGPGEYSWHMADALRRFFWLRSHFSDWLVAVEAGLRAATAANDIRGVAMMHGCLGNAHLELASRRSQEHFEKALEGFRALGDTDYEFHCLTGLGNGCIVSGHAVKAVKMFNEALALAEIPQRRAMVLTNLGIATEQTGQLIAAARHLEHALECYREAAGVGEASTLCHLSTVYAELGKLDEARTHANLAYVRAQDSKSHAWERGALLTLARIEMFTGGATQALLLSRSVLDSASQVADHRRTMQASHLIGNAYQHLGRLEPAIEMLASALRTAEANARNHDAAYLMIDLGRALLAAGRRRAGIHHLEEALRLSTKYRYSVSHGRALATLACVHFGQKGDRGRQLAEEAYTIQRTTGHQLGQAEALLVLGRSVECTEGVGAAEHHLRLARKIFAHYTGDETRPPAGVLSDTDLPLTTSSRSMHTTR